jgi:plastocyanin
VKRPLALLAAVSVSLVLLAAPLLAVAEPPKGQDPSSTSPQAPPQKKDQQAETAQPTTSTAPQPQPDPPASPAPRPAAVAAGANSVSIHDFAFGPQSLTIHVGDRVTWFNQGPSGHSATANNGSFNTGVLAKGASGSFTFTTPGTFSYHCTPHPFMKASVTVLAASSGSGGGGNGSKGGAASAAGANGKSGAASPSSQGSGSTSGGLPRTGLDVSGVAGLGLLLLAGGLLVRRRISGAPGA